MFAGLGLGLRLVVAAGQEGLDGVGFQRAFHLDRSVSKAALVAL